MLAVSLHWLLKDSNDILHTRHVSKYLQVKTNMTLIEKMFFHNCITTSLQLLMLYKNGLWVC